MKVEFDIFAVS